VRIVDAHTHLWDLGHVRLSWFRPTTDLPAVVTASQLGVAVTGLPREVRAAIAVQAGDTLGEAEWLLEHAAEHPLMAGVVLQYDARSGEAGAWAGVVQPVIEAADAAPRVCGVRVPTAGGAVDLSDVDGLDQLADGLAASGRLLELLIRPEQMPAAASLAARHPELAIVVCHLGLGAQDPGTAWRDALASLASRPNVNAKLSGVHSAGRTAGSLASIASTAFDTFGADRLMFGSDWPMSARFAPYPEVVDRTADALPELDARASETFWNGTATRLYGV
jgi:L-fuconolactonase